MTTSETSTLLTNTAFQPGTVLWLSTAKEGEKTLALIVSYQNTIYWVVYLTAEGQLERIGLRFPYLQSGATRPQLQDKAAIRAFLKKAKAVPHAAPELATAIGTAEKTWG